ncbi:hypothetical protein IWZ03DRAFT_384490 [Phyllosticta citriasiana]|uniref:Protoporphyrinogen oxidase n=1 Tax=Phyllosticta citriasiana TaxID=595635 RepID=A0ABR1KDX1_9PEZI
MQSRSHALLRGTRLPRASLSPPLGHGCASYKQPRRCYATPRPNAPKKIAVLGGGITGLSTAYYLSRSLPKATITLYEASNRLGGWLQSKREPVPGGGGYVTFEQGPRTLRKSIWGMFTLELALELGLRNDLRKANKNSPAAQNRYIFDQDHILRLPTSIKSAIWASLSGEKVIFNALKEGLFEWKRQKREHTIGDESIGDFLARRGLKKTGEDLVSAFLHGVYAGNIEELSARSTPPFDRLWNQEWLEGSITRGLLSAPKDRLAIPRSLGELVRKHLPTFNGDWAVHKWYMDCSVFALKDGLGSLANALENRLIQKNVNIIREDVTKLEKETFANKMTGITVHTQKKTSNMVKTHDLVISALPAKTTSKIALAGMASGSRSGDAEYLQSRQAIQDALPVPTVTVMVVNLFYRQPGLVPHQGFGYLIPNSVALDQNPERALGVIFDSDIFPSDSVQGTQLTVMLGGHWWSGWPASGLPSEEQGIEAAKSLLARHLKIEVEPALTNVTLQKDCIPQYKVGHHGRMTSAHEALQKIYEGRVRVVGNSYTGVGVHDCVVAARLMAMKIEEEVAEGQMRSNRTGLELDSLGDGSWIVSVAPRWLQALLR